MIFNHLFWIITALLCWSALNIKVYIDYEGSNKLLGVAIGTIGWLGAIAGLVSLVLLSLQFNWWWFFYIGPVSLLFIGLISFVYKSKENLIFGIIGIFMIPFLWWWGSKFNTILSFDWFYNFINSIDAFIS